MSAGIVACLTTIAHQNCLPALTTVIALLSFVEGVRSIDRGQTVSRHRRD
jgi:hypothetical protein